MPNTSLTMCVRHGNDGGENLGSLVEISPGTGSSGIYWVCIISLMRWNRHLYVVRSQMSHVVNIGESLVKYQKKNWPKLLISRSFFLASIPHSWSSSRRDRTLFLDCLNQTRCAQLLFRPPSPIFVSVFSLIFLAVVSLSFLRDQCENWYNLDPIDAFVPEHLHWSTSPLCRINLSVISVFIFRLVPLLSLLF